MSSHLHYTCSREALDASHDGVPSTKYIICCCPAWQERLGPIPKGVTLGEHLFGFCKFLFELLDDIQQILLLAFRLLKRSFKLLDMLVPSLKFFRLRFELVLLYQEVIVDFLEELLQLIHILLQQVRLLTPLDLVFWHRVSNFAVQRLQLFLLFLQVNHLLLAEL